MSNIEDIKVSIRKEVFGQISRWLVATLLSLLVFALLGWWNIVKPWLSSQVRGVPAGAIVAVIGDVCIAPWKDYKKLEGRFALGTTDVNKIGIPGGNESGLVMLRADQLPKHEHPINAILNGEAYGAPEGWNDNSGGWWRGRIWVQPWKFHANGDVPHSETDRNADPTRKAEAQAGGEPKAVDIMPPFVALKFCTLE
jgi:hypothetical protein